MPVESLTDEEAASYGRYNGSPSRRPPLATNGGAAVTTYAVYPNPTA